MNKFYITTPIYYPSGKFHIGTAYTTIFSDVIARYYRLKNYDVRFLTGNDEHGLKIEIKAKEAGKTPQEYVDEIAKNAITLWKNLNITNDDFIRTTETRHIKQVEEIFNKLYNQGDIYLGKYSGLYCIPCEAYYTKTQAPDNLCPECKRELKMVEEETYFFNIKKYEARLIKFYEENPEFLLPLSKKNEIMNNFIKPGLEDLSITRTSFKWGIKTPINDSHVIYVWLDALMNYVTSLGYLNDDNSIFNKYWPADLQIIGKDIVRFHAIYWPIFLMALDLPLPKKIFVHDFIMMKNSKMSKSFGNVIYPDKLIEQYGVDATRYTILKSIPYGSDGEFNPKYFIEKYNNDLCNDLGNLLNRTIAMINKYNEGIILPYTEETEYDQSLETLIKEKTKETFEDIDSLHLNNALSDIISIVSRTNKYIDETSPWNLAKEPINKEKLNSVMFHLFNSLRIISILLMAFLPTTSEKIFDQLGITDDNIKGYESLDEKIFNIKVISKGIPLFNRLDEAKEIDIINDIMNK